MFLVFWPRGMWDLSSLTRDQTRTPCVGRQSLNHWTVREVLTIRFSTVEAIGDLHKNCFGRVMKRVQERTEGEKLETVSVDSLKAACAKGNKWGSRGSGASFLFGFKVDVLCMLFVSWWKWSSRGQHACFRKEVRIAGEYTVERGWSDGQFVRRYWKEGRCVAALASSCGVGACGGSYRSAGAGGWERRRCGRVT